MLSNKHTIFIGLILAPICDLFIPYLLTPFYKGYSNKKMVMSVLGNPNSPVRYFYRVWLVLLGILLLVASFEIYSEYGYSSSLISLTVIVLIDIFAVGACILSGLFSVNQQKNISTLSSKIHGTGSVIGFTSLLFVPFLIYILLSKSKNSLGMILSLLSFLAALFFFFLFIMSDKPRFENTIIDNEGIWQRLALTFMYVPIIYIGLISLIDSLLIGILVNDII